MVAKGVDARARRIFAGLLADMSTGDVASLIRFKEFKTRVGTYDLAKKTIFESFVPWPIVLLLSRHSPKHQFPTKSLPSMSVLRGDLENCVRKLKWRYNLHQLTYEPPFKISKAKVTPRCKVTLPAKEGKWLNELHQCMLDACNKAHLDIRGRRHTLCKTPKFIRYAFKLLKEGNWKALANDKGGGFTLVSSHAIGEIEHENFGKSMYTWEDEGSYQRYLRILKPLAIRLTESISKLERSPELYQHMMRPLRRPDAMVATLQLRVKAHKEVGNVTCRAIHANPGSSFEAISRWLVAEIRGRMSELQSHIISNASAGLSRIRGMCFLEDDHMIKIDLKDFYYSGSADELIEDVMSMWELADPRNKLRRESMQLLLHNQLVKGKVYPAEGCYRVQTGSGMGLIHSGDIADAALLMRMERWLTKPQVSHAYNIRGYVRFKDDALLVVNKSKMIPLCSTLKAKARYFNIIYEKVSSVSVNFLEFLIYHENNKLKAEYVFKDRPCIPLSMDSMHNRCVHRGWPRMIVRNIWKYSENEEIAKRKIEELRTRLASSYTRILWPSAASAITVVKKEVCRPPAIWWPISFHPLLKIHLNKALASHSKRYASSMSEISCILTGTEYAGVKIAWKSGQPRLEFKVR